MVNPVQYAVESPIKLNKNDQDQVVNHIKGLLNEIVDSSDDDAGRISQLNALLMNNRPSSAVSTIIVRKPPKNAEGEGSNEKKTEQDTRTKGEEVVVAVVEDTVMKDKVTETKDEANKVSVYFVSQGNKKKNQNKNSVKTSTKTKKKPTKPKPTTTTTTTRAPTTTTTKRTTTRTTTTTTTTTTRRRTTTTPVTRTRRPTRRRPAATRRTTTTPAPTTTTATTTPAPGYLARLGNFMSNLGNRLATGTGFLAAATLPLWVPINLGKKRRRRRRDLDLDDDEKWRFDEFYLNHVLRVRQF